MEQQTSKIQRSNELDIYKFEKRPNVQFIQRPEVRRKQQTAISSPNKNFFQLMYERSAYFWIIVKLDIDQNLLKTIEQAYKSVRSKIPSLPICKNLQECMNWIEKYPCQVLIFQDAFQLFHQLQSYDNAAGFHVVSVDDIDIAKAAHSNKKIKAIYDQQQPILKIIKQSMQRVVIAPQPKASENGVNDVKSESRQQIRNAIFPNFIKLSKHDKSDLIQYRINLVGLRKLTAEDKSASKDKFIQLCREKFVGVNQELARIDQYDGAIMNKDEEILRFYSLDSFFYKSLNNTLRIARNTQQFFAIGEPFNRMFDAIKNLYKPQETIVYRGADLTKSQTQYLQSNIGKYIQITGFVSTSRDLKVAQNFARSRKKSTIFQIRLKKVDSKYKQFDYGFVDFQLLKCSAFEEDQILLNALNTFKIQQKVFKNGFQHYVLSYGTIFDILQKNIDKLDDNQKFAYMSYKQLQQMNQSVSDIGSVYLSTNQPEKAIKVYQLKLQQMRDNNNNEKQEEIYIKAADAYLANGQPDQALKYYQSVLLKKKRKSPKQKKSKLFESHINQILSVSTKITQIQNNFDQYEQAESILKKLSTSDTTKDNEYSTENLWAQITATQQVLEGKMIQLLYKDAFSILQTIDAKLQDALKTISTKDDQKLSFETKKVRLKKTQIYQRMAQVSQDLQIKDTKIINIFEWFNSTVKDLQPLIQKDSYEQGLINVRRSEIIRRTKKFDQVSQLKNLQKSLTMIKKHTNQTDTIIPRVLNNIASLTKSMTSKIDNSKTKSVFKQKQQLQTLIYGQNDARPLNSKMQVAICQRDDKNTYQSLQIFDQAYHTNIYKSDNKFSTHAKIMFNMAQAYSDKGDDGLAMKCYANAYQILFQRLSKRDFENSILRFKIRLKMGRLYMTTSLTTQSNLIQARKYLLQYHNFIIKVYKYKHTDVGLSYNSLGALQSALTNYSQSKKHFVQAKQIYEQTLGQISLDVAKIKINLAVCYARLEHKPKALKTLFQSQQIFDKIFKDRNKYNPYQYESKFVQAKIYMIFKDFIKAIQCYKSSIVKEKQYLNQRKMMGFIPMLSKIQKSLFQPKSLQPIRKNNIFPSTMIKKTQDNEINNIRKTTKSANISKKIQELPSANDWTQHYFKCKYHICQCLIKQKIYTQAMAELKILTQQLTFIIGEQRNHPLFKSNNQQPSKKTVFLKKAEDYLTELTTQFNKKKQPQQSNMRREQSSQNRFVPNNIL